MIVIGICGSSGAGKSTLCAYLQKKGYTVSDCDAIYRRIIVPPSLCLNEIEKAFGSGCLNQDGSLNRNELRRIVFSDPEALKRLNRITFSFIIREVKSELEASRMRGEQAFFIDAPLLFESGLNAICDHILGVFSPMEDRILRLCQRDGLTEEQIRLRLSNQTDDHTLCQLCTDTINNDGNEAELHRKADAFLRKLGI